VAEAVPIEPVCPGNSRSSAKNREFSGKVPVSNLARRGFPNGVSLLRANSRQPLNGKKCVANREFLQATGTRSRNLEIRSVKVFAVKCDSRVMDASGLGDRARLPRYVNPIRAMLWAGCPMRPNSWGIQGLGIVVGPRIFFGRGAPDFFKAEEAPCTIFKLGNR
jgi:hypothetical protein